MVAAALVSHPSSTLSLEEYLLNPPERMEWVNGDLREKNGMTAKHGRIQARLAAHWFNYKNTHDLGGEVYTETPCRTVGRGRCPDVAYLTPDLVAQFGDFAALPQSFSLIAEIISPTDQAEEVFMKVKEYLQSGCQEVWLLFPESQWILAITKEQQILRNMGEIIHTQKVLPGFSITVDELLA